MMFPQIISTLADLPEAAQNLLPLLKQYKIVAFYGAMGAGKTTLIKALCEAMGISGIVNSPTFSLVNVYRNFNNEPVYHFDFYRINKTEEVFDLGYEEYFFSGHLCFIEWPERIASLLPPETLHLHLKANSDETRELNCMPPDAI